MIAPHDVGRRLREYWFGRGNTTHSNEIIGNRYAYMLRNASPEAMAVDPPPEAMAVDFSPASLVRSQQP